MALPTLALAAAGPRSVLTMDMVYLGKPGALPPALLSLLVVGSVSLAPPKV